MAQVLIFANPIAGRGQGAAIADEVRQHLLHRGYGVSVFLSKADSTQAQLPPEEVAAAIVIGGDGTLRGVAQWAVDRGAGVDRKPYPLLIIPMGTANLMGKHLGIAWDRQRLGQQVVSALEHGHVAQLDVARTPEGIFLLMAGVGLDAAVVHELSRVRSGPIRFTSYVLPFLRTWLNYRFPKLTATVDGQTVATRLPSLAFVGNVPEYGTGFPILPLARSDDGLLDVCVLPCNSQGQLLKLGMAVMAGEHLRQEGVVYLKGRSIRIECDEPAHVQVDGEAAGMTPLSIDLLPQRIPFIVPGAYE